MPVRVREKSKAVCKVRGDEMYEKLKQAKPSVLMAWMLSAGVTGFGLGALFADYIPYAPWIALPGFIVHVWAMYKIYG